MTECVDRDDTENSRARPNAGRFGKQAALAADVMESGGPPDYDPRGRIKEPAIEIPAWITTQTAAKMIGIRDRALYQWIDKGYGPPVYSLAKKHYLFKKNEVELWIEKRRMCLEDPIFRVLTISEAAQRMSRSRWHLHKLIQDGKGPPAFIFNGRYVVRERDFEEWRATREG